MNADIMMIVAGAIATASVAGLVGFVFFGGASEPKRRVDGIRGRWLTAAPDSDPVRLRRDTADSSLPGFDRLLKRYLPNPEVLRRRLARTGRRISIGEYVLVSTLAGLVMLIGIRLVFGLPVLLSVAGGIVAGVGLPHLITGILLSRREKRFTAHFPDAIDLIVRGLRSGFPVNDSIRSVGEEMPDPVGVEFRAVFNAQKLGQTLEDALWEAAGRVQTPEFKFFVVSLVIQRETGGNLSEILENLSDILRRRRQMGMKVKAMSSEARASAMIIGSLPFIIFGVLLLVSPDYVMQLFTDRRGTILLAGGLVSMALGVAVMAKMVKFEI